MMVCVLRYAQSIFTGAYALETAEVFFFFFSFSLPFSRRSSRRLPS